MMPPNRPQTVNVQRNQEKRVEMTVTRRQFAFTAACFLGLAVAAPQIAMASSAAEAYVNQVGNGVIQAANSGSVDRFRSLLSQNADIPSIALFSLGQYRSNLPEGSRQEYYRLVEHSISSVFAAHTSKLAGKTLTVSGSRSAPDSVIVASRLEEPGGRAIPVLWRVVQRGGGYKIFDVNVDGVWLANTQRTSFTSVLQRNNGSVEALMQHLRR
jgi:phospholipid transport system substrate-binding protein